MNTNVTNADLDCVQLAASVAAFSLGLPSVDILTTSRGSPAIAFGRHVAMYLCHVGLGMSLSKIANALQRDRSTVAYGCHTIEDRREDPEFDEWIDQVEQGLRGLLPLHCETAA
ncbi:MAG: helix-turn-helix domain-containing protein [Pseudomonadota bacterium]